MNIPDLESAVAGIKKDRIHGILGMKPPVEGVSHTRRGIGKMGRGVTLCTPGPNRIVVP
jgi:hypothetical protein